MTLALHSRVDAAGRITVDQYHRMIEGGILTEGDRSNCWTGS
jgi:hypothetical protein